MEFYPPTRKLVHDYESLRKERIEEFYNTLDRKMERAEAKEQKELLKPIVPEKSLDQLVEEAKAILPNILNKDWEYKLRNQETDRDVLDTNELKKQLSLPHTRTYQVRGEIVKYLREQMGKGNEAGVSESTGSG